jgi:hypothetical protein
MMSEAYRLDRDGGYVADVASDLFGFAELLSAQRKAEMAAQLLSRGEALNEEIGAALESWAIEMNERTLTALRAELDEAVFTEAWKQGRALTPDEAVALALKELADA